jgi:hypothetical protein
LFDEGKRYGEAKKQYAPPKGTDDENEAVELVIS